MRNSSFVRGLWVLPLAAVLLCGTAFGGERKITNTKHKDKVEISITYPDGLGHPAVDAAVRDWAVNEANEFMAYALENEPGAMRYELDASYELSRPSARAVSVVWHVGGYSGGPGAGDSWYDVQTYDLQSGKRLELKDLFAHPKKAAQRLSALSISKLTPELRENGEDLTILREAAGPDPVHFANLALTPSGVRILFNASPTATWKVEISLEELKTAGPRLEYWGR